MARRHSRLPMGELEAAVMSVLWDAEGWHTPGDVHRMLEATHPVAYTTVMTVLVRLWRKGRLDRRPDGRAFAYHPVLSREDDAARRMGEVLSHLGDHAGVLTRFVDTLADDDRAQLRRLLSSRRSSS